MDDNKKIQLLNLLNELTVPELQEQLLEKAAQLNEAKIQIRMLENDIEQAMPKIKFFNAVASSDDLTEMSAVAKILNFKGMGRNKLFEYLRNKKILRWNNEPYQSFVDQLYFKVIEQEFKNNYSDTMISYKTMVTQKGLDYIRKLLLEEQYEYNKF